MHEKTYNAARLDPTYCRLPPQEATRIGSSTEWKAGAAEAAVAAAVAAAAAGVIAEAAAGAGVANANNCDGEVAAPGDCAPRSTLGVWPVL